MENQAALISDVIESYLKTTKKDLTVFQDITKFLYKNRGNSLIRNGHSLDCCWSDPSCEAGPDTCRCFYQSYPRAIMRRLLEEFGPDYIIWSHAERLKTV